MKFADDETAALFQMPEVWVDWKFLPDEFCEFWAAINYRLSYIGRPITRPRTFREKITFLRFVLDYLCARSGGDRLATKAAVLLRRTLQEWDGLS